MTTTQTTDGDQLRKLDDEYDLGDVYENVDELGWVQDFENPAYVAEVLSSALSQLDAGELRRWA